MLTRIVRLIHAHGSAAGIQLAHAGRKGSTNAPWMPHECTLPPMSSVFSSEAYPLTLMSTCIPTCMP